MKVKLTPEAAEDIAEIREYISGELSSPAAADRIVASITKSYKLLKSNPFLGVSLRARYGLDTTLRRLVSGNYCIIYEVREDNKAVEIYKIYHSKRNYIKYLFPDYDYGINDDNNKN